MRYACPVCAYGMEDPAIDYHICPCCGTEFGYHDVGRTPSDIRAEWLRSGANWWSPVDARPDGWNPYAQLIRGGLTVVGYRGISDAQKSIKLSLDSSRVSR